jgi:hypothetical protein
VRDRELRRRRRVGAPRERLDGAVAEVAHPTGDVFAFGGLDRRVANGGALHDAADHQPPGDHRPPRRRAYISSAAIVFRSVISRGRARRACRRR